MNFAQSAVQGKKILQRPQSVSSIIVGSSLVSTKASQWSCQLGFVTAERDIFHHQSWEMRRVDGAGGGEKGSWSRLGGWACCNMRNRRNTDWLGVSSQSVRIVQMLVRESQFSHGFRLQQGHGKVGAEGKKNCCGGRGIKSGQCQRWWQVTYQKRCLRFPLHWFKWKIVFDKVLTSEFADIGVWHKWTGGPKRSSI